MPEDLALRPELWTVQVLICKRCGKGFEHQANGVDIPRNEMLCEACRRYMRARASALREVRNGDLPPDADRSTGGARAVSRESVRPKMLGEIPDGRA